jgi:hypothetical protein
MPQKKADQKKGKAVAAPRLPNGGGNGGNPCQASDRPMAIIEGPSTIAINALVDLTGTADEVIIAPNCHLTTRPTQFSWALFFTPPGGTESAVGGLNNANTLTPSFVASSFGVYRVALTAGYTRIGFITNSLSITVFRPMELLESEGHITFLRVNEVGDSFGPAGDSIQVEAIIQLDSQPGMSFGWELRNDKQRPAHQGMLDLCRDAFANNSNVLVDYWIPEGNQNGTAIRIALTK